MLIYTGIMTFYKSINKIHAPWQCAIPEQLERGIESNTRTETAVQETRMAEPAWTLRMVQQKSSSRLEPTFECCPGEFQTT